MPTATSLSGWSLLNFGPATTVFSAPASCATAYRTLVGPATDPTIPSWNVQCPWAPPADCNPNGARVQSIISAADQPNPTAGLFVLYQSPGLVCGSGQLTVGAAEKVNPTSTSVSGAFNLSNSVPTDASVPYYPGYLDVMLAALDPGETAILCCPSSYTPGNGACYSAIPTTAYKPTTGCRLEGPPENFGTVNGTWVAPGGKTITGEVVTITGTLPLTRTTTTFAPSDLASSVGVAVEGMGILIHRSTDVAKASVPTNAAGATTGSGTAPTTSSTSKPNAGIRMEGSLGVRGVVLAVWCMFFVVGTMQ